jgi:membrane protein
VHLWQAIMNFKDRGTRQAAALSYYAVFSVFPLTLLLAVGIGSLLGPAVAKEQIYQGLVLFLPEESDTIHLFQDNLEQALEQSRPFGWIALVGLTWSALGLFSNLTSSLDLIFQAHTSRSLWRQRVLAFLMTLVLIVLVSISFVTSGLLQLVDAFLLSNPSTWITIGTIFLPLGLDLVIFLLMFRYVPSRNVSWDAIWPAAIIGAIGFELAKSIFSWYLGNLADFQFVYGSIATVIVLMLWAFVSSCIFLVAAEICAQLNLWLVNRSEAPRIRVFPERAISQLPAEIPPPV